MTETRCGIVVLALAIPAIAGAQRPPAARPPGEPPVATRAAKPASAIPTDYRWSGDDGITLRFREALEHALDASPRFNVDASGSGEKLRLSIPTNLYWSKAQGRTNFQYIVIFTDQDSRFLGVSVGPCWDDAADRAECADSVLDAAADAWKRRSKPQPW